MNTINIHQHTNSLCRDIYQSFRNGKQACKPTTNPSAKRELIANCRQWVEWLVKVGTRAACHDDGEDGANDRRRVVANSLSALLRALDDVDVDNFQYRSRPGRKKRKRTNKVMPQGAEWCSMRKAERRRTNWTTVRDTMHDIGEMDTDDEEDLDSTSPTLVLSNSDRYKRAMRSSQSQLKTQHSCSMMGISFKAVMNASMPSQTEEERVVYDLDDVVTTLPHDAAVLRRDLYKYLAEVDIAEIASEAKQHGKGAGRKSGAGKTPNKGNTLQRKIKEMAISLLDRISSNPESPSMRLSAIVAADSLREMDLGDWGYRCILEVNDPGSIQFFVEILCECHAYENPLRLLQMMTKLMQQALATQHIENKDCKPSLLRAISHILVRRQNIFGGLSKEVSDNSPLLQREIEAYKKLCERISLTYDSLTNWITPTMSSGAKESIISALKAQGIVSLFCFEDSEDEDNPIPPNTPRKSGVLKKTNTEEYPYPQSTSLRATHDRMGPCDGVNRLISLPASYENKEIIPDYSVATMPGQLEEEEDVAGPLSDASEEILRNVFSFLGYRSLTRASQCCVSWHQASTANSLWATQYFRKYNNRGIHIEEELASAIKNSESCPFSYKEWMSNPIQLAKLPSTYNWKHMFISKYTTENHYRKRTCTFPGCLYVVRRADHFRSHIRRHESAAKAHINKQERCKVLEKKVKDLHLRIGKLEGGIRGKSPKTNLKNAEMSNPGSIMRNLIFPFLGLRDIVKCLPVCKLWEEMLDSNQLWKSLYHSHFGKGCPTGWLMSSHSTTDDQDWKLLSQSVFTAQYNVQGQVNEYGQAIQICPAVGCNKELRSKLEYDLHILRHEEKCCREKIKCWNKAQRDMKQLKQARTTSLK